MRLGEGTPRGRGGGLGVGGGGGDAGSGNQTRATLVGGERYHHCTIPVPSEKQYFCSLNLDELKTK